MPAYEYRRVPWGEVPALGLLGWRMVAVPPVAEVKNVLGQPQMGEPLYAVERETATASESDPRPEAQVVAALREYVNRTYGKPLYITDGEPPSSKGSLP